MAARSVTLLFLHGWGFDAHLWDGLRPLLGQWPQGADDRGYFCAQQRPAPAGPLVAVTHSFGTMRLLAQPPAGLVGLVAINGFSHFCAGAAGPGVNPRVVAQMRKAMVADPARVLSAFRAACGVKDAFPSIDASLLAGDLAAMQDDARTVPEIPVLSLEGARDHLLEPGSRDAQFAGAALERFVAMDGGHMLPLTHPAWCAAHIARFVERLAA